MHKKSDIMKLDFGLYFILYKVVLLFFDSYIELKETRPHHNKCFARIVSKEAIFCMRSNSNNLTDALCSRAVNILLLC